MENKTTNTTTSKAINNDIIKVKELISLYIKKWYWFAISVFLCLLAAFVYLKISQQTFKVETKILIRQDENSIDISEIALLKGLGMKEVSKEIDDEIQIIKSENILRNAVEQLDIATDYFIKDGLKYIDTYPDKPIEIIYVSGSNPEVGDVMKLTVRKADDKFIVKLKCGLFSEKYEITETNNTINSPIGQLKLKINKTFKPDAIYKIKSYPIKNLLEFYSSEINVSSVSKKTNAIRISINAANTQKAVAILNKLVDLYNMDAVMDKNIIASNTKDFIDERLTLIQSELTDIEQQAELYKKSNNLTNIKSEAKIFLKSSNEYDKKIDKIETQLNLVNYIEELVKDPKNKKKLVPNNLELQDVSINELISSYNSTIIEHMKLIRSTNNENPIVLELEQKINTLRDNLIESIVSLKKGYIIAIKQATSKNNQFISKIKDIPTQERKYLEIKRQQKIKQKLYLFLLEKREENALTLASTIPSTKTLDKASASTSPESPKLLTTLFIALILGGMFPIIILYVKDLFNNKITNKNELTSRLNIPFAGSIGISEKSEQIVVKNDFTSPLVEMFRMLRTNLQFMLGDKKSPVILVTSSIPGEGKSFVAINLALSFALTNKKVVLLELDIRRPTLNQHLALNKQGVTLFLSGQNVRADELVNESGIHPNLKVILAGQLAPNPTELLMSNRLEELIEFLKKEFDYIIIDSAPAGVVSDTFIISRVTDNTIYVVRQNYSNKDVTDLAQEIHESNKLKNMCLVLNGVDTKSGYGYGYDKHYRKK